MAGMMCICSGLAGPKSENVEKPLVFKGFLEGQRGHEEYRERPQPSEPSRKNDKKGSKKRKNEPLDMRWQV